jgi:hypothetical protein
MTTVTLEVPDGVAKRLDSLGDRLPQVLSRLLESSSGSSALTLAASHPVYQEMMDFLGAGPGPQRIVDFKISSAAQERLESLLEKNREEGLSEVEATELDVYELVHHSMIRLKAHARAALSGSA